MVEEMKDYANMLPTYEQGKPDPSDFDYFYSVGISNVGLYINEELSDAQKEAYLDRGLAYYGSYLQNIFLVDDDEDPEFVNVVYDYRLPKFDRIRRITGYLVGTLDRFNDAKRSEESDRVKHEVSSCC